MEYDDELARLLRKPGEFPGDRRVCRLGLSAGGAASTMLLEQWDGTVWAPVATTDDGPAATAWMRAATPAEPSRHDPVGHRAPGRGRRRP